MNRWQRGSLWILAGLLLGIGMLALSITGGGNDDDPKGAVLAVLVVFFYLGFSTAGFMVVRGILMFMQRLSTRGAMKLVGATVLAIVLAIVLHNLLYALTDEEEPFFFLFALFVGPVILIAAIIRAFRPYRGAATDVPSVAQAPLEGA